MIKSDYMVGVWMFPSLCLVIKNLQNTRRRVNNLNRCQVEAKLHNLDFYGFGQENQTRF